MSITLQVHHDGKVLLPKKQYLSLKEGQKVILFFPDLEKGSQRRVYRVEEILVAVDEVWVGGGDFLQIKTDPRGFSFSGGDGRAFAFKPPPHRPLIF